MSTGFIIRDNISGVTRIGVTDRLTQKIGRQRIVGAPGSFIIPITTVQTGQEIFFYIVFAAGMETRSPAVNRSGRTLSWGALDPNYFSNPNVVDFDIIYGVY